MGQSAVSRDWVGVVLAGGASRRMGADKALIEVGGRPMVVRVADALRAAGCDPVVVQGGDRDRIGALGLTVWPDAQPGAGPVAALSSILERLDRPVVIAACDLPDLDDITLATVIAEAAAHPELVAVAAAVDGRPAMVSAWRPSARDHLPNPNGMSYRSALNAVGALLVPVDAAAVKNVNTVADLG